MAANPYPHIGWNPVPGIPAEVTKLQQKVGAAATALENTHQQLTKLTAESSYWPGDAAEEFRKNLEGDLPKYLKKAASALRSAATQLHKWDGHLTSNRALATKYDAEAAEKKAAAGRGAAQRTPTTPRSSPRRWKARRKRPPTRASGRASATSSGRSASSWRSTRARLVRSPVCLRSAPS